MTSPFNLMLKHPSKGGVSGLMIQVPSPGGDLGEVLSQGYIIAINIFSVFLWLRVR